MTELEKATKLAEKILDRPNADPDDDLALLARQFKRQRETVQRMHEQLREVDWNGQAELDLIHSNRDAILNIYKEAIRRIKKLMGNPSSSPNDWKILAVIEAANTFHPMHCESWKGWPEGSEP